jgi:hypothetical protein
MGRRIEETPAPSRTQRAVKPLAGCTLNKKWTNMYSMKTVIVLLSFSLVACGQTGNPRAKALADAVARGDKALAAGQPKQASAAWSLLLLYEPNRADVQKKIDALPPGSGSGNFSRTNAEIEFLSSAIGSILKTTEDLCGFPPTPDIDLAYLR